MCPPKSRLWLDDFSLLTYSWFLHSVFVMDNCKWSKTSLQVKEGQTCTSLNTRAERSGPLSSNLKCCLWAWESSNHKQGGKSTLTRMCGGAEVIDQTVMSKVRWKIDSWFQLMSVNPCSFLVQCFSAGAPCAYQLRFSLSQEAVWQKGFHSIGWCTCRVLMNFTGDPSAECYL